ncbi:MAG: tryptophan synthase subunit alpha [Flavobacteriales bacterium]|nr:tryptophan synthase subunit alpha [Flavobacteriales bacterium]
MANRLDQLFESDRKILSIYCTAGYPELQDTVKVIRAIEQAGGDLIEIGIPFSDPLADGPIIQASGQRALENGMSLKVLFEALKNIREAVSIPLILMGYVNTVLAYGFEKFCQTCEEIGIDGTIIPDLPLDEYVSDYKQLFNRHGLYNIGLITPQTTDERVQYIDAHSEGFVYMVSSASTTGGSKQLSDSHAYFERIRAMKLTNPTLIGFNIHNQESFNDACTYSKGGIIGSAFIKSLRGGGQLESQITTFIEGIRPKT